MLPPDIGPEEHIAQAKLLQHPFLETPPLERDLRFAVRAYGQLGPAVPKARRERLELLKKVAKATAEVDTWLLSRRHVAVEGAPGLRPFFAAFCVVLLEWPDVELPTALLKGFPLTRRIAESGVFRPVEPKPVGHKVTLEPG